MHTRTSGSMPSHIDAKIVSEDNMFHGYIENVSEHGIEYIITTYVNSPADFTPNKIFSINFQVPSGSKFNLMCELIWYLKNSPDNEKLLMGMKVISPQSSYKYLMKNLNC